MRLKIVLILIGLSIIGSVSAADEGSIDALKEKLAGPLAEGFTQLVEPTLIESGLAKSDVERIIAEMAETSSACFVESYIDQAEQDSVDTDQLIANALIADAEAAMRDKSGENFVEDLNAEELMRRFEFCFLKALENAGVQLP